MQRFEYRGPRFPVDLSAQFTSEDSTLAGRCTEIGIGGLRLELEQPLPSNASGTVTLSYRGQTFELSAHVVHAEETRGGLEFIYSSDEERSAVAHLVESLAAPHPRSGPTLLKRSHF